MRKITIFILKTIILICSIIIIYKCIYYYKDSQTYADLKTFKPEPIKYSVENSDFKSEDSVPSTITSNEPSLIDTNSDYKFWISIANTNIDYPVVKGTDNEFYLYHDFNKNKSESGCLFIDSRNVLNEDKNMLIYGHNMRNGTMFNTLSNFKNEDFFLNNSNIEIIENNKLYIYDIFSVYTIPANDIDFKLTFENDNDYLKYLNLLKENSWYEKNISLDVNNNMITLVTCSYEYSNARTVVHAIERNITP